MKEKSSTAVRLIYALSSQTALTITYTKFTFTNKLMFANYFSCMVQKFLGIQRTIQDAGLDRDLVMKISVKLDQGAVHASLST